MHTNEAKLFTGQPVLNQLLRLIPPALVGRLSKKYDTDRYCKTFFTKDHVVTMLANSFMRCSSLQELISGLQANAHRLLHLGLVNTPRKSTLADANVRRTESFFGALFLGLHMRYFRFSPDSPLRKRRMKEHVYIFDSTTITLFSDVLHGTGRYALNGKKKGGAKAHVLMREEDDVPCFIDLTEGKKHDQHILPMIKLPQGSILVFDMGYASYKQWRIWAKEGYWWVTRLKDGSVVEVLKELPVTAAQAKAGVVSDQLVRLGNDKNNVQARLVCYHDPKTAKQFAFISNNQAWAPTTVARLYKQRWDIEQLFKRVKQNYPLRHFLGDSANAIKIQIWCAFIADLLLQVVHRNAKRENGRKWTFANIAGLVRIHMNNYIDLMAFLRDPKSALLNYEPADHHRPNQLQLFVSG